MIEKYVFHAGEATVLAAEGQCTDAMPEILIGRKDGPVGQAFANMMAQTKGHTAMFAIRACNQLVRPVACCSRTRPPAKRAWPWNISWERQPPRTTATIRRAAHRRAETRRRATE